MSKETFREAVFEWTDLLVSQDTLVPGCFQIRQVNRWQSDPINKGSSRGTTLRIANWAPDHISKMKQSAQWDRVKAEAATWPALAAHMAENNGCAISVGAIHADLGLLMRPFEPFLRYDDQTETVQVPQHAPYTAERFERFADYIESDTTRYQYVTPIGGLSVPDDALPRQITNDIVLEKLTSEQADWFGSCGFIRSHMAMGNSAPYDNPSAPWLALRWSTSYPKIDRSIDYNTVQVDAERAESEVGAIRDAFVASLALTKFGTVTLGATKYVEDGWGIGNVGFSFSAKTLEVGMPKKPMFLTQPDLETAINLFGRLRRRKHHDDPIGLAARRLVFAMDNSRDEDRLLDGMIAAEAIMGDFGEIKFKIALRTAFLLEPVDKTRRRIVFDDMQNAYEIRSRLVHGKQPETKALKIGGTKVPLPHFVEAIEDHIRTAARNLVITGGEIPEWNDLIVGKRPEH